jgi:hypothetical protein
MIAIDFILLTILLLPPLLRQDKIIAFIGVFTTCINYTQQQLQALFNQKKYQLTWNGQVMYLEKYLNDIYGTGTAIYITTNDENTNNFLFNTIENNEECYAFNNSEFTNPYATPTVSDPDQVYLYNFTEIINFPSFIVYVPSSLIYNPIVLKNQIDQYRLAGKTYQIVEI